MRERTERKKIIGFSILSSVLFILALSSCFLSGMVHPNVKVDETAEYVARIAKDHTVNGKYAALLVETKDSSNKTLRDTNLEFYDLYGVFRQKIASFASTVNADHLYDVRFKDIETENLSYLYVTSGMNSVSYGDHFKHESYPLELMFQREKDPEEWGKSSFGSLMYISQNQANKFLDLENLEHTEDNYKSLLKRRVFLTTNGVEKEWQIEDIYLEQNYFYDALKECAGEFVLAWSTDAFQNGPKKQSMYFCSNYAFRNSYYFNYATSLYPLSDFNYKINNYNFKDNFQVDGSRLVFDSSTTNHVGSSLILVFGIALLVLNVFLIYFYSSKIHWWHHVAFGVSLFVPYLIFKLLFVSTKKALYFSTFSTKANLIMILSTALIYSIVLIVRSKFKHEVSE